MLELPILNNSPANENEGHIVNLPVALISLNDKADRRNLLVERGLDPNWVHTYFPATDFRGSDLASLGEVADLESLKRINGRSIRPAEIGCASSHKEACQWLSRSNFNVLLVLEDDVIPQSQHYQQQLLSVASYLLPHALAGSAFICHLGPPEQQVEPALKRQVRSRSAKASLAMPPLYLFADPDRTLWRAHAYLISKPAAERALEIETKITTLADDWCERRTMGILDEIFFTWPKIFQQDEEIDSTIRPPDHKDHYKPNISDTSLIYRVFKAIRNGELVSRIEGSIKFRSKIVWARMLSRFTYHIS
ncbi:MAG: glycosyltransferase family 25 protein [Pseudomonadota bacterium]